MLAVAAAALDEHGTLIEANAGFLRLLGAAGSQPTGVRVPQFFIQPDFATLMRKPAGPDGQIHRGLLTFGDRLGQTRSLQGRVWRRDRRLLMLAEYDITELEQLYDTVLALNREYANAQLELAQINLKLQQREAQILAASLTDPLTGVGNRRRLEQALAVEANRAAERTGGAFALRWPTSTASSGSTTRMDTRPATRCLRRSGTCCASAPEKSTSPRASVARSSWCSCRQPIFVTPLPSPNVSEQRLPSCASNQCLSRSP
jgi:hypothetical protein